ncbi:Retrotransposon gag protein [Gossypium australe]|uniref:Retrotransposon gag protein n=1 Tax=Gossypium australe TaxID=47621 RepID=A0A5B6WF05_9ROSI|nr:Retrotransposon gag protein [Gossypium australe]
MNEDPNQYFKRFLTICDIFKYNRPVDSINTWDELVSKFLAKYFPSSKTMKIHMDITNFQQLEVESLYKAWKRFKLMLRKCPYHVFYNGLDGNLCFSLDGASARAFMSKTYAEACQHIEDIAMNSYM